MTSSRLAEGSRLVGTSHSPSAWATAAIGTLTKNTEPQEKCCSSNPPATGPSADRQAGDRCPNADPAARSFASVKVWLRIASVAGRITAVARSIRQRATISAPMLPDRPANAEKPANATNPGGHVPGQHDRGAGLSAVDGLNANGTCG